MTFVPFIDITGEHAHLAPLVRGGIRAYYATGSQGIMETAAQIAQARSAGLGIILIDQTPGLALFRAGLAHVADVEANAGTPESAATAVAERQAHTEQSTLYVSFNSLPALKAAIRNPSGVLYGVADYSWSQAQSEQLLTAHPDWAYTQYGDNISNAATLVPGPNVTCGQAACDIDIAKGSWAAQFMPRPPVPPPPPPGWVTQAYADLVAAVGDLGKVAALVRPHLP